jgi:FlaA1/EpsC-like NDP-sugar epimerase
MMNPPQIDFKGSYDTKNVTGKTVLITGGASGLGEAMFRRMAKNG